MNSHPTDDKTENGGQPEKSWEESTRRERRRRFSNKTKGYIAGGLFVAWIVFVALWLLFVAGQWEGSFFDNVAVIVSAFFIAAGAAGMMFSGEGPEKYKWRVRVSISGAVALIVFFVMWFPFASAYFGFYQNAAILFAVFMIFLFIMAVTWVTVSPVPVLRRKGLVPFAVTTIWALIVLYWLWFIAPELSGNQNVAIAILAILLLLFVTIVATKTSMTIEGEVGGQGALALIVTWMILMVAWFWFYADVSHLNSYQNGAVAILTFLLFIALSYLWERKKHRKDIPDDGW